MKTRLGALAVMTSVMVCLSVLSCSDESVVETDSNVANTNFAAEESFYEKIDLAAQVRLIVDGISGGITIAAVAGSDSIVVAGVRRVRSESVQDAEAYLDSLAVNIVDSANEVSVETVQPKKTYGRNCDVEYDVVVPGDFDLDIDNVNGQIVLDDIAGDLDVDLVNGQVDAEVTMAPGGVIDIDVINGGIELNIPKSTSAQFSAEIVNGSITMSDLVLQDPVSTSVSLRGTLGLGDGTIALDLVNGTISVVGFD
jgi:hypothetical protein